MYHQVSLVRAFPGFSRMFFLPIISIIVFLLSKCFHERQTSSTLIYSSTVIENPLHSNHESRTITYDITFSTEKVNAKTTKMGKITLPTILLYFFRQQAYLTFLCKRFHAKFSTRSFRNTVHFHISSVLSFQ